MIRWTTEASRDFDLIRQYIAADNPSAAARQCDLILRAVGQIDLFPRSGRKSNAPKLRELAVPRTPYIIFYSLSPDALPDSAGAVVLVNILHGAMLRPNRRRQ